MPWPTPTPESIAERLASGYESALAPLSTDGQVDARGPHSPLAAIGRVQAMASFDLYLDQRRTHQEMFPDTAEDEFARHASIWGVPRREAAAALGYVRFVGPEGLALPTRVAMLSGNMRVTTGAAATITGGQAIVPARVDTGGSDGNFSAGTVLTLVSPIAGLTTQAATVQSPGFAGGQDQEGLEEWRARVLDRIRNGVPFGEAGAYETWARQVPGVALAAERRNWIGRGTMGVVVAWGSVAAPAIPSPAQLAEVQARLEAERPVTVEVVAVPVEIVPLPLTVRLSPDTSAVRAAVTAAYAAFLASEPGIGGTIERSRLAEAISAAAGEYAHRLDLPAASVALGPLQLAVPGTITWAAS
jgi:uncharacterized phage protein gp47/JayE